MTAPRFRPLARAAMTAEQGRVHDATRAGRRGTVPANVQVWLASPGLADRAQRLGAFLRYDTALGARLSELAILLVARRWSADYEWAVHAVEAARAGLTAEVIAAVAAGQAPPVADDEARVVAAVTAALLEGGRLDDATFVAADATLGRARLVELVALVGYYTLVAFTLNAFDVPAPDGAPRLP
ncbi:MAG: carboxymuconolactone decarboxylase family protein [Vicinamibacterales bacterium]